MKVSVIICTRNRARSIIPCLESVAAAARVAALTDAEIVVADNASNDGTSAVIQNWAANCSIPLRLEYEPRAGITIAKNRGLRSARGNVLVLTDDDCRFQEDYFNELLRLYATDADMVLRGGRVELGNPADLPLTIKTDTARTEWHIDRKSAIYQNLGNCFLGCNLFMSRSVYERLGPFDEHFGVGRIPAGEDTDYIFRAYAAGMKIEYVPDVVVSHHHGRRTPDQARRLWRNYMIASGALYAKYLFRRPSLCRQLRWDVKYLIREIVTRENLFFPEYDFSYADKLRCYTKGALYYIRAAVGPNQLDVYR
jgi:glycosyltransferase involved in cell wall biosynthesis